MRQLEKETKIKKEFLIAIEKESWSKLPDYTVVAGFVKRIADALETDMQQTVAFLRRDYPPQNLPVNPKPDAFSGFRWSPRLTFLLGIIFAALVILGYLGYQYVGFVQPPSLEVISPTDNEIVSVNTLNVSGTTDSEATLRVNNQPVLVDENGEFSTEVEIFEGTEEIVVKAVSRSGKESIINRTIIVELED